MPHDCCCHARRRLSTPSAAREPYAFDVEDVEYARHGDKPLLMRLAGKPRRAGPFPLMIDLHGGAWCNLDRTSDVLFCETLAKSGVLVAALDFRMPPEAAYPASLADINYAIRWLKAQAKDLECRADKVGLIGISSGGHQAVLAARCAWLICAMPPSRSQALLAPTPRSNASSRCGR